MALFGLFGKKDNQSAALAEKASSRAKRAGGKKTTSSGSGDPERIKLVERNARANATAKKIDAIESEMSSEFSPSTIPNPSNSILPAFAASKLDVAPDSKQALNNHSQQTPNSTEAASVNAPPSTDMLLGEEDKTPILQVVASETAQVIEEAAILFANQQTDMAEQLLREAVLNEQLNKKDRIAWSMLFDLYQITGNQEQFESLSIDYANRFETSPPAWTDAALPEVQAENVEQKGIPAVAFSGKLDSSIVKLLERVQKLGKTSKLLRLEFARVTEVDPVGCGLLLRVLNKLQDSGHDLILVGASELIEKIRSILQVGRRDETEAPWLLMLELLRLLNQEPDFEEASIDYCITFEVSPPAFVAPANKITTAAEEFGTTNSTADCFMMPATIDSNLEQLLTAIQGFTADHQPAVLDCSRLNRVDFSAAGQLLSRLAPLCCDGKSIEMHHVNHLVSVLFTVIGLKDVVQLVPRKL